MAEWAWPVQSVATVLCCPRATCQCYCCCRAKPAATGTGVTAAGTTDVAAVGLPGAGVDPAGTIDAAVAGSVVAGDGAVSGAHDSVGKSAGRKSAQAVAAVDSVTTSRLWSDGSLPACALARLVVTAPRAACWRPKKARRWRPPIVVA